jgi:hypothetical protein
MEAVGLEAHERSPNRVDKSLPALAEARRLRDKNHLKYVASRSCLICGRQPSEPHHVRFAQRPAFGRKVSDESPFRCAASTTASVARCWRWPRGATKW